MYKITVPVKNANVNRIGRESICRELHRLGAQRVLLTLGAYELDKARQQVIFDELDGNCRYFKEQGFEVGAWLWTFSINGAHSFNCMRSIDGCDIAGFACPSDAKFIEFAAEYVGNIAKCGVDLILFDDDFRYGFLSGKVGCLCKNHVQAINRLLSKNLSDTEIYEHIISGQPNKVRNCYLQANGDYFKAFAKAMRESADKASPSVRLGACACMSSWDIDGTNARELAYILAGNTKPLVRLIGAPYWAVNKSWGCSLQDVCELERMESAWTSDNNIEIIAEGDTWPRPRSACPAAYLEGFDTAMRVSGTVDGILKYGIDYYANIDYETGYAYSAKKNIPICESIDSIFADKKSVGVRVYEFPQKISQMVMPTPVNDDVEIENLFFSKSARLLANNTIPTVYAGEGACGIVFDENARHIPCSALANGLILDIAAAEILTAQGIDVGLCEIGKATFGFLERFLDNDNRILTGGAVSYEIKLKNSAEVLSVLECDGKDVPLSYKYENESGQRFFVLNVNTRKDTDLIFKNYARSRQLATIVEWLSGEKLPAYAYGHPSLYIQCKESKDTLSVGLWNFFADPVISPKIELSKSFNSVVGVNCQATICDNCVTLDAIQPFGFAFFEVRK